MDIPGYRLHPLKGELNGRYSVWADGNWRLTFEFHDGDAYLLDYEDGGRILVSLPQAEKT
jgi:proteic killer suppression protein